MKLSIEKNQILILITLSLCFFVISCQNNTNDSTTLQESSNPINHLAVKVNNVSENSTSQIEEDISKNEVNTERKLTGNYFEYGDYEKISNCNDFECADSYLRSKGYVFSSSRESETFPGNKIYEYLGDKIYNNDTWKREIVDFSFISFEGNNAVEVSYTTSNKEYFEIAKKFLNNNNFKFTKEFTQEGTIQLKYLKEKEQIGASLTQIKKNNEGYEYLGFTLHILFMK